VETVTATSSSRRLSAPAGLSPTPAATLTGPDGIGSLFGRSVAGAGDVNGDAYADVVVGAEATGSGGPGWAYVYLGGATGLATSPAVRWVGPENGGAFGRTVANVVPARIARLYLAI